MRVLIATAMRPTPESFGPFCESLRVAAGERGLQIPEGILFTGGKNGAANLAFELVGGEEKLMDEFARAVTMALMPARWTTTTDSLPKVDTLDVGGEA